MSVVVKNEYTVRFAANDTEKPVIATSMALVAKQYESPATPIAQITRVRANVESVTEDPVVPVNFVVTVSPQGAIDGLCKAAPAAFAVSDGDEVIFQAFPTAGFTFVGWYLGGVKLSSALIAKLPVNAPAIAGQTVQFLATFVAV